MGQKSWIETVKYSAVLEKDEGLVLTSCGPIDQKEATVLIGKPSEKHDREAVYFRDLILYLITTFLIVGSLVAQANYLIFKLILYSRNSHEVLTHPRLLLILICECAYFVSAILGAVDNCLPPRNRPELGSLDDCACPVVHIFYACCKEASEIPIECVRAALALDYPQDRFKIFVLDDGADDELRAICQTLQVESAGKVEYLRRLKIEGVPHHFKCGNMNYGLQHSTAEYIVMMDADMILHPSFLRRLMPHIVNSPNVSFVQIPQAFYNLPVGDPLTDSSTMGYHRSLFHRDSLGFAACIGTGVVFRRKHLDEIGGFQHQSITEDTLTAYALFNRGYESVYVKEIMQMGLAPWTFKGYVKQRERWARGGLQQFAATWKQTLGWNSRLNVIQKLIFFNHAGYIFMSIFNVILLGVMLSALAFNMKLTVGSDEDSFRLISYLALYLVLVRLSLISMWSNLPQSVQMRNRDESHFWWMAPYFLRVCFGEIFSTTSKEPVFVATSTFIDGTGSDSQPFLKKFALKVQPVSFHIAFAILALSVVIFRATHGVKDGDCSDTFYFVSVSLFLITTSAHMLVPVAYILFPPNLKSSERKSLLRYDSHGVPKFCAQETVPKWSWTAIIFEVLYMTNLLLWTSVLIYVASNTSNRGSLFGCKL